MIEDPYPEHEDPCPEHDGPYPADSERRQLAERRFVRTGNAFFAWEALESCLAADVPIPPIIKPYFVEICCALLERKTPVAGDLSAKLGAILLGSHTKGRGRGSAWEQYKNYLRDFEIASEVQRQLWGAFPPSREKIYEEVGPRFNLGADRVKRICAKHDRTSAWDIVDNDSGESLGSIRRRPKSRR